jgi:hypothetical protein
VLVAV